MAVYVQNLNSGEVESTRQELVGMLTAPNEKKSEAGVIRRLRPSCRLLKGKDLAELLKLQQELTQLRKKRSIPAENYKLAIAQCASDKVDPDVLINDKRGLFSKNPIKDMLIKGETIVRVMDKRIRAIRDLLRADARKQCKALKVALAQAKHDAVYAKKKAEMQAEQEIAAMLKAESKKTTA